MSAQLKLFESALPRKPYCQMTLQSGLLIGQKTSRQKHISITNLIQVVACFDIDRPTHPEEAYEMGLPAPNVWIQNPVNRHAHLLYS